MGVAGLLRSIIKDYPSVHFFDPNFKVDYLFFDFNCLIYNSVNNVQSQGGFNFLKNQDNQLFKAELLKDLISETKRIINVVKPQTLVYIAIDGVPPLAKMLQQRERRYKRIFEEQLKEKYFPEKFVKGVKFDTNQIIPGTKFMDDLTKFFKSEIKKGVFGEIAIVFDGPNVPGEAEHKYLSLIDETPRGGNFVIYSKDGDQIFLSLRFPNKNIFIMQPISGTQVENKYSNETEFFYLDIKKLSYSIGEKFNQVPTEDYLFDVIFLSFLTGNDFIPEIFFLTYREDYLKTPLGIYNYQHNLLGERLVDREKMNVNQKFLTAIFNRLKNLEEKKFLEKKQRYERNIDRNNYNKNKNVFKEFTFIEVWKKNNPLQPEFIKQFDETYAKSSNIHEFKKRYYQFNQITDIKKACENYLKMLVWNLRYYFGYQTYWEYCYPYLIAPFPSDIYDYLIKNPNFFQKIEIEIGKPANPESVALFSLPPQTLTPETLDEKLIQKVLKKYPQYFPEHIKMNLLVASKFEHVKPFLIEPNIKDLNEMTKNSHKDKLFILLPKKSN